MARPVADHHLQRFWFPLSRGFGIGVTAASLEEARELAEAVRARHHEDAVITGVIPDIDVSSLDAHHVVPNLGFVVAHGVWFPALNTHGEHR